MASAVRIPHACVRTLPRARVLAAPPLPLPTLAPPPAQRRPLHATPLRRARRGGSKQGDDKGGVNFPSPDDADAGDVPFKPAAALEDLAKRMRAGDREAIEGFHRSVQPGETLVADVQEMYDELAVMADQGTTDRTFDHLAEEDRVDKRSFWYDEDDPESVTEDAYDLKNSIDMPETAHIKLQEMKEQRHYARLIAWEMPLLSKFAQTFRPPADDMPLRFRYTSFMGETHPSESKVVVQFCPDDLSDLTKSQKIKLRKLAGPRWNPEKDMVHMSCEGYETQAQNKRHLSKLVDDMVAAAKDETDMFEDVPLDTRHHKRCTKPKFPPEWRVTPERREQLEGLHRQTALLDEARRDSGIMANGSNRARAALKTGPDVELQVRELLAGKPYTRLSVAVRRR